MARLIKNTTSFARAVVLCLFIIGSFLLVCPSVSAHQFEEDGTIGALLHVYPDDEPIAGSESRFYFYFQDRANINDSYKFNVNDCTCELTVYQTSGSTKTKLYTGSLLPQTRFAKASILTAPFVFHSKGNYLIEIDGRPKRENDFKSFHLEFEKEVTRSIDAWNLPAEVHMLDVVLYGIFVTFVIIIGFAALSRYKG